jgi:LPS-assembly protein
VVFCGDDSHAAPSAFYDCMFRFWLILAVCLGLTPLSPALAGAQDLSSCKFYQAHTSRSEQLEDISRLYGSVDQAVRIDCDEMQFFADYIEIFKKQDLLSARGNIVFVSGANRIAADRVEFNTRTRTGTFYNARGEAALGERVDRSMFGTQEPEAVFWGAEVQKLGPTKYRIVNGGFTTCVQPTPRWEVSSGSFTVNLDDYALLKHAVLRVKGVPLLYLPVFYYPVQEDDRATGFLLPTYGTSTLQGQKISNAFFWALGRSHDATIYHDWLTKAGQQVGSEYRYVLAPGSQGHTEFALLSEKALETTSSGAAAVREPRRSFSLRGNVAQVLPRAFRATANADYFSSVETQQRYQQDLYRATNRRRNFGGHVTGSLGQYLISAAADRNDLFYDTTSHVTYGSLPRVTISRPERPIARAPLYFGVNGEYVTLVRSTTRDDIRIQDQGLTRMDVNPVLRVPFNRWPFLGVNSVVSWRGTYWTESLTPAAVGPQTQVQEALGRQFFDFQARITGPVFNKIFNPPQGVEGLKFKHVIQPTVVVQRVTAIDQFDRIVKLEGTDYTVGGLTRYTYGLTNRFYAKKTEAREVVNVSVSQTYYTRKDAAQYDRQYQSSFTSRAPTNFSPVALHIRTSPLQRLQAEFRTEWDPTAHAIRTISASGTYSEGTWLDLQAGWSQRRFIPDLEGFNDPFRADQYINASANLRGLRNRLGGNYTFNYDLLNDRFLHQRWVAYYNAQCCGIGFEYQTVNLLGSFVNAGVPQDRRFNISFTLAGIGTFSNLFGAFGGQQGR